MSTLTNVAKHTVPITTGGEIFFGWMFMFTRSVTGQIHGIAKHSASLTSVAKH